MEEEELLTEEGEEDNDLRPVASSMVAEAGYDPEAGELVIVFNSGREERYPADKSAWEELKNAPSIGKWLHQNVL